MNGGTDNLADLLRTELLRPVPPEVTALAETIVDRHGESVAAILFYGSCLRDSTVAGLLDLYVLVDDYRRYHRGRLPAGANRLLPPTVSLWEGPRSTRAKVAVISRRQFAGRMRPDSLDVTLWSRFCQPAALVHARDPDVVEWAIGTLACAASTAAQWAVRLGPAEATSEACWVELFRRTYRVELRPETEGRAQAIHAADPERYDRVLRAARLSWRLPRTPSLWWWPRHVAGKLLTVARLVKASFTFADGADYIVWKIERHTGERIHLTAWQREHPVMAAPLILWRLWRRGVIR